MYYIFGVLLYFTLIFLFNKFETGIPKINLFFGIILSLSSWFGLVLSLFFLTILILFEYLLDMIEKNETIKKLNKKYIGE